MNLQYEKTVPAQLMGQEADLMREQQPQVHWGARLALAGVVVVALLVVARFIER